ncbi:MAG: HEAT repeat domain-containing protein [Pseudomonadota bacterium]
MANNDVSHLLSDEQYLAFLNEGFVVLQPESLDDSDHNHFYQRAQALYKRTKLLKSPTAHLEILGDNLRAQIPELDKLLDDPVVTGAVKSIVGENAALHPHNFVHQSSLIDQAFHQDGNLPWNERGHYRAHRPDWLLLFYYPQEVDETNGPTEIIPGTQYWTRDIEKEDGTWHPGDPIDRTFGREEMNTEDLAYRDKRLQDGVDGLGIPKLNRHFIHVPKGSVVLANYDLIHRGSRKLPNTPDRFMYKFHYARTQEPETPAWHNQVALPSLDAVRKEIQPVVQQIWQWSRGETKYSTTDINIEDAQKHLSSGREDQKIEAAYQLGMTASQQSPAALQVLTAGLYDETESTRRASSYGLRTAGATALDVLAEASQSERASVRRFALYALGNIDTTESTSALNALLTAIADEPDDLARSNAAYALGQVVRARTKDLGYLTDILLQRLKPGVEPNNTEVALLPRSTVRQSVAFALMLLAYNHKLSDTQTAAITNIIAQETDRYVKGMLLEALCQVSTDTNVVNLIKGFIGQRWNTAPQVDENAEKVVARS